MTPKAKRAQVNAFDEILALLEYLDDTLLGPVARLAAYTGLRRGELLGLTWDAVDFERRVLHVRQALKVVGSGEKRSVEFAAPKTDKSRRDVALTAGAVDLLRAQHAQQSALRLYLKGPFGDERLVFPNPRTGNAWKPDTFSNEFAARVSASGLPKATFHSLRHSFASISLRAGIPLKVVSETLGHTTIAITGDIYQHVLGDLKAEAADRLDAIFNDAKLRRAAGSENDVRANCGPITPLKKKNLGRIRGFEIAPAGVEV